MTDTDIVTRLAREAGMDYRSPWATGDTEMHEPGMDGVELGTLARFAALVADECAFIADQGLNRALNGEEIADAIHARFKA